MMGDWDEHLVSDAGSFYLGLTAITIIAFFARRPYQAMVHQGDSVSTFLR
jgi:hypothetical protein